MHHEPRTINHKPFIPAPYTLGGLSSPRAGWSAACLAWRSRTFSPR